MHVGQWQRRGSCWTDRDPSSPESDLVLMFGDPECLGDASVIAEIRNRFPSALIAGCSTAGEIQGTSVFDQTIVGTSIRFASTRVRQASRSIRETGSSYQVGLHLAEDFHPEGLRHLLVFSDGLAVNGSELVRGLADGLPAGVSVTGGLSGDGDRFGRTLVISEDRPQAGIVSAVGLYGSSLRVGCGSLGGWDPFGPERLITRSRGNVLFEMDGKPALELYRRYLAEHAQGLPGTGLLFPLSIHTEQTEQPLVRTILGVTEADGSLTFAGDVPEGARAQLMKANFNRLVDGAAGAAQASSEGLNGVTPELALLISCVGRKMVLRQRVEEEVEQVRDVLGTGAALTGFYSYGEIAPFTHDARCELHNQTMTVTALAEIV